MLRHFYSVQITLQIYLPLLTWPPELARILSQPQGRSCRSRPLSAAPARQSEFQKGSPGGQSINCLNYPIPGCLKPHISDQTMLSFLPMRTYKPAPTLHKRQAGAPYIPSDQQNPDIIVARRHELRATNRLNKNCHFSKSPVVGCSLF